MSAPWVLIETVDRAGNLPPVIIEHGRPPLGEGHLWREATEEEYQRYLDYYSLLPHQVHVDEEQAHDGGTMFKAFCETCEWSGERWHHADEYQDDPRSDPDRDDSQNPVDLAYEAARAEGDEHEEEGS